MPLPKLSSTTDALHRSVARFPIPILFAGVVTFCLVASVESDDAEFFVRLALIGALGFVGSLLLDLWCESGNCVRRTRLTLQGLLLLAVGAYGAWLVPEILEDARPPFWYSHFILLFALHLAIALLPLRRGGDAERLWTFNLRLFLRFFFSSVNSALLFVGLALAVVSVDKLFGLDIDSERYAELWFACAFLAHPLLFLSGVPVIRELEASRDFPRPLRFSLQFIALPLVTLYLLILYAYVAKIAIQWSWPNGWVAMPIFVLSVISLLSFVLSVPLSKSEPWATLFHRWLFRLLLPLSIVLFLALQIRLGDYGMTINRYLGLVLALWLFGLSLTYILRPQVKIGWMPFSLMLISLFAIYSGPIGAFGWSERSQTKRIHTLGAELGILEAGVLVPATAAYDESKAGEFRSALRYLLENSGRAVLEHELSGFYASEMGAEIDSERAYYLSGRIVDYLEIGSDFHVAGKQFNYNKAVIPTYGHSWQLTYHYYSRSHERRYPTEAGQLTIQHNKDQGSVTIRLEERLLLEYDSSHWAEEIANATRAHGHVQPEPLSWHTEGSGWRFSFVLTNAYLDDDEDIIGNATLSVFFTPPESN